jgi:hypothetical protein
MQSLIALMMEEVSTSETSVNFYQATRRNIPEDSRIHTRRRENLKSHQLHGDVSFANEWVPEDRVFLVNELMRIKGWQSVRPFSANPFFFNWTRITSRRFGRFRVPLHAIGSASIQTDEPDRFLIKFSVKSGHGSICKSLPWFQTAWSCYR